MKQNILFIAGTRPEVIKVAPAVKEAKKAHPDVTFLLTGQHKEMARQVLGAFGMQADIELDVMRPGASLSALTARLIETVDAYYVAKQPAIVVVQGDTSSAAIAGLIAYYHQIPVAHIEAGLRSYDNHRPFPEEVNRKVISTFASLNFAPTPLARENLLKENVPEETIIVTGNTVVDAVQMMQQSLPAPRQDNIRRILVTTHRRESWGTDIAHICQAIRTLADVNQDIEVLLPVHKNPVVADQIHALLGEHPRINLTPPLDYISLQKAINDSYLILTDSGGIQEEAPSYGVPVLVLRKVTERPEAVNTALAKVVGTDRDIIIDSCQQLLNNQKRYQAMTRASNPFGDGLAGKRIAIALKRYIGGQRPLLDEIGEFKGS